MGVTRDYQGRAIVTHQCPECGARFLGPATCRPCPANDFAHPKPVEARPIYGCAEPPDIRYAVALGCLVCAQDEEQAYEVADGLIDRTFPKRMAERLKLHLYPIALETRADVLTSLPLRRVKPRKPPEKSR